MKTITLDDKTYKYWQAQAQSAGLTVEQLFKREAEHMESIERSQQQFAEGKGRDARTVMREIAAEKGIEFNR